MKENIINFIKSKGFSVFLIRITLLMIIFFLVLLILQITKSKTYTSCATIYAGFITGIDLENINYEKKNMVDNPLLVSDNVEFDNFIAIAKSRNVSEKTAIKLLTYHLIDHELGNYYPNLSQIIEDSHKNKLINTNSYDYTNKSLYNYYKMNDTNSIFQLLNSNNYIYSIKKINSLKIKRIGNSEMFSLKYSSNKPYLSQQTLEILIYNLVMEYREIYKSQINRVLSFNEDELIVARNKLNKAENELLHFQETNKIINYYEQMKFVAKKKEELDSEYIHEIMALKSAKAAVSEIESRMTIKTNLSLQNDIILKKRKRISSLISKITFAELQNEGDLKEIIQLREEVMQLKMDLTDDIQNLHTIGRSTSGLPMSAMVKQWLKNVLLVEEANARASVVSQRMKAFYIKYDTFAPLNSEKRKIERNLLLAENEFFNINESLIKSRLKGQNIEACTNIIVFDKPTYSDEAEPFNNRLLIKIGGIVLIMMILSTATIWNRKSILFK